VSATVTSSNPHVTFPKGNGIEFEDVPKNRTTSAGLRVALNGAVGIETTDFSISISSRDLNVPGPFNVVSTQRLNYDDKAQASATDSVESKNTSWTVSGDGANSPNILSWQRRALSPTQHVWWGPDNNGQNDDTKTFAPDQQILTSPVLKVGSAPLVISFSHRFSFESTGWDGGVIELSADGGSTWTDIGTSAYNGSTNAFTNSPIGTNRKAFVNRMVGWPAFAPVGLNLGTAFANKDVKIRFRIGADDSTGAPGWEIDEIAVSGITNTPFGALVPNAGVCTNKDKGDD
jgi:hypothetical protein